MFQVICSILVKNWTYRTHMVRKDWAKLALDWRHVQGNHRLDSHKKQASVSIWHFNKLLYLCSCKTNVFHKIWNSFHETRYELVASWAACWRHIRHTHILFSGNDFFIIMDIWTARTRNLPWSTTLWHYIALRLVCVVLWVRLRILGQ